MTSSRISSTKPDRQVTSGKRENGGLTDDRILQAALNLIDAGGISALKMRDLGRVLGTSTMAVYRHFHNKADLLEAVIDHVVGLFQPSSLEGSWQVKARAMSLNVREAMLAHPELADLIGREFRRSPTSLRVNAKIIETLRESGVPDELLAQTYWAISSYTTGYALLEAQVRRRNRDVDASSSRDDRVQKLSVMMQSVDGISTYGLQLAPQVLSQQLDDTQFLFGLECLISGLEARIANRQPNGSHSDA